MMKRLLLALAALALLPSVGAFSTGPFAGAVAQDQVATHEWDNSPPPPEPCPQYFAPLQYRVVLSYAPAGDVLTLRVERGGDVHEVEGEDGFAVFTFEGGGCEPLTLRVIGTQVAAVAAYALHVWVTEPSPPPE